MDDDTAHQSSGWVQDNWVQDIRIFDAYLKGGRRAIRGKRKACLRREMMHVVLSRESRRRSVVTYQGKLEACLRTMEGLEEGTS